jgi:hypothetical protein
MNPFKIVQDFFGQVEAWPIPMLMFVALIGIGLIIRSTDKVGDRWILPILSFVGSIVYVLIGDRTKLPFDSSNIGQRANTIMCLYGLVIGVSSWAVHWPVWKIITGSQKLLLKFLSKRLGINGNGDTSIDNKPKE